MRPSCTTAPRQPEQSTTTGAVNRPSVVVTALSAKPVTPAWRKRALVWASRPSAEDPVVEGAKRHGGEIVGDGAARRPDIEAIVDLQDALAHAERLRHPERRSACRRLHGPDLVPVDEQDVASELTGDGKATEARSNHDGVIVPSHHIEPQHTANPVDT